MRWNKEEIEELIDLFNNALTYHEIALKMNKTYGSVRGKLQKLGYKYRDGQIVTINCLNCNSEIKSTLSNERKFCNNSCSATYNNKLRVEEKLCLNCNINKVNSHNNCCSKECAFELKRSRYFTLIENGDTSLSEKMYKKYLIHKHGEKCMECGWCEVNPYSKKIPIQLEHMDGNSDNNSLNNLKLLCPNCHSITPTYGALNKGNGRTKRKVYRKEYRDKLK